MRVLDTRTGQFKEIDPKGAKYAILSHTWDRKGEQTYEKLRKIQKRYAPSDDSSSDEDDSSTHQPGARAHPQSTSGEPLLSPIWDDRKLSPKIREACRVARENGYDYVWIDSCCIDKTSSSELSESINSMFQWYASADVCYAFLPDVPAEEDHRQEGSHFRCSRWFMRGWTLQELIAPLDVRFLSTEWTFIGSKEDLADVVVEITNIQRNALLNIESLDDFGVAERFSWAAQRETTRVEDQAYSLLGIFNINMPTLYGEREGAFRRLQEEIMRRTPDRSLFAWTQFGMPVPRGLSSRLHEADHTDTGGRIKSIVLFDDQLPLLTSSLNRFRATEIRTLSHDEVACRLQFRPNELSGITDYTFTPHGIRTQFPVISLSDYFPPENIHNVTDIPLSQWYLIILGCGHKAFPGHLLARLCYIRSPGSHIDIEFLHSSGHIYDHWLVDLFPLSPAAITHFRSSGRQISIKTLYIPQPERDEITRSLAQQKWHQTIKLVLPEKTREALSAQGYTATLRSPDDAHPRTHSVTLSHDTHTITVDYQHALRVHASGHQGLDIGAHVRTSGPILQGSPLPVLQADGLGSRISILWRTSTPWKDMLHVSDVELDVPGGPTTLTIRFGLAFARTNYYLVRIELKTADPSARSGRRDSGRHGGQSPGES